MANELEKQLVDVKKFLNHHSINVRLKAVEIVSGCSNDSQLHPFFTKLDIGKQLLQLINDNNKDISYHSCVSLVNLSSNPNFSLHLLESKPFNKIIQELRSKSIPNKNKELMIKIMVNMTQTNEGISHLLQKDTSLQGLHIIRLFHILRSIHSDNYQQIRTYHYLPFIFTNISQNDIGRELIMEPQRNLIQYLIPFMDYNFNYYLTENNDNNNNNDNDINIGECYKIFHRGIWNTIRNCMWLLNDEPTLLLKKMDKKLNNNDDKTKDKKEIIHNYYLKIFLDHNNNDQEWTKNHLIFEIINPIIGPLHEYQPKLRKKLLKNAKSIDNLLKRMKFDKFRFDDDEIRKIALQCLHLIVGVDADFDLDIIIPKLLNDLFLSDLLKEYEIWETSSELIRISKDIRSTLKHQLDKLNKDKNKQEAEIKQDTESKQVNNDKLDNDTNDNDDQKEMEIAPMAQQYHHVETVEKKTFNEKESNVLFDLVMAHSNTNDEK